MTEKEITKKLMKGWKIGYKVVRKYKKHWYSFIVGRALHYGSSRTTAGNVQPRRYRLNKETKQRKPGGPLAVFQTKDQADDLLCAYARKGDIVALCQCLYLPSNEESLYGRDLSHCSKIEMRKEVSLCPDGTILASSVILLQMEVFL